MFTTMIKERSQVIYYRNVLRYKETVTYYLPKTNRIRYF
ncbi:protein of unknown function [Candidatus Nitrosocosmicus franklandus]|uniref:Uncharacterized protein n=1 Tax=Candidatus Nitrosocosmicus franklandianus TaxID=1798806 RepID=A0A484I9M4_9ARCH|nr:protein of unknown function [Candidatus Nitrosocosmicus franklandus]